MKEANIRLLRTPIFSDIPIHDQRRLGSQSPEELIQRFRQFPLNKGFIDWAFEHELMIVYSNIDGKGYYLPQIREIIVNNKLTREEINLTIAHELLHAALPGINPNKDQPELELALDEIAQEYSNDEDFMRYVMLKIPSANTYNRPQTNLKP
ncbi:MAG: hypothetical protein AAB532_04070 [Patescibacteria group bacterium]